MKKILALTLCVVMAAAFTGCGSKSSNGEADGAPITVISREDGSGTRGAFTEMMGDMVDAVENTTTSAEISQSTSVVLTTVAGNKNSIGYVSLGSLLVYAGFLIEMVIMGQMDLFSMPVGHRIEMYVIAAFLTAMAYWKHRENIKRLLSGTERKTYLFKKNKEALN